MVSLLYQLPVVMMACLLSWLSISLSDKHYRYKEHIMDIPSNT